MSAHESCFSAKMLHLNDSNRQFTVSLDSFDLLMSQYVENSRGEKNDTKKVLWANSVSKEPDFFEVEIVSDDEFMKNNSFIEQHKSLPCYICNINVPQNFYNNHNKSKIHQNYKKLTEKFLENVSKQMNIDIDNTYNHAENDMLFCETCSLVISKKYKKEHENSYYHLKSIDREELTTKFLAMYNSDNDFQNDAESGNDPELTTGLECNSVSVTENSDNSTGYSKNTKPESKSLNDSQNRNRVLYKLNDNTSITNKKHALVETLQDRKLENDTAKIEESSLTQVEKLNEYDKHFSVSNKTQLNCELTTGLECNSVSVPENSDNSTGYYSKNTKAESESLNDSQNRNRLNRTWEDIVCRVLNKLNNNTSITNKKHALVETLQDEKLENDTAKIEDSSLTQVEKLNEYDKHFSVTNKTQLNCELTTGLKCNSVSVTENSDNSTGYYSKNTKAESESLNDSQNRNRVLYKVNDNTSITNKKHALVETLQDRKLENDTAKIEESSLTQVEKLNEYDKHFSVSNKTQLNCELTAGLECNSVSVPENSDNSTGYYSKNTKAESESLNDSQNRNRLNRTWEDIVCRVLNKLNNNTSITNKKHALVETLQDEKLENDTAKIEDSSLTQVEKLNEYDKHFSVTNKTQLNCELTTGLKCNRVSVTENSDNSTGYYSKNTKAESESLNDSQNRNRLNRTWEDIVCRVLNKLNDNTSITNKKHALVETLQDRKLENDTAKFEDWSLTQVEKLNEYDKHFSVTNKTQLNCLVCLVSIPNYNRNIIEHAEGLFHRNRSASLLQDNYIEKVSGSCYRCYLCNKYTNYFIRHIDTNRHKKELAKGPISKILLRHFVYEDPNNKNLVAIYCRQQYNDELERNKIIRTENTSFYCEVCRVHLSRVSEIDHMYGERHRIIMAHHL